MLDIDGRKKGICGKVRAGSQSDDLSPGGRQCGQAIVGHNDDYGQSVRQTSDGGYIVVGTTESFEAAGSDIVLFKFDGSCIPQWYKIFGGSGEEAGISVWQTTDNGYVVAGATGSFGAGKNDVYLIKTNQEGTMEWSRTFGGPENDIGYAVQQTKDGGYIIAGEYGGGSGEPSDMYVIKTDEKGYVR